MTAGVEPADPRPVDPLSDEALTREIERCRRSEYRLLVYAAVSFLMVAVLIFGHIEWLG